ncbi:MAG: hypothetical protein ACXWTP_00330 [Methylosarcina sp.]
MGIQKQNSWFPGFEFHDYQYQSFLILPTTEQDSVPPSNEVNAKRWAKGQFICGQAFNSGEGYSLDGVLRFESNSAQKPELKVLITGTCGEGKNPASFEGTGTGIDGPTKGAIYSLVGWAFRDEKQTGPGGSIIRICGSVRAVRGPDNRPERGLGDMPLGTAGAFVITSIGFA